MTNPATVAKRFEYKDRPKTCIMPECEGKYRSYGLCQKHYSQAYRHFVKYGWPSDRLQIPVVTALPRGERTKVCTNSNCESKVRARGLCTSHYFQFYRQDKKNG